MKVKIFTERGYYYGTTSHLQNSVNVWLKKQEDEIQIINISTSITSYREDTIIATTTILYRKLNVDLEKFNGKN